MSNDQQGKSGGRASERRTPRRFAMIAVMLVCAATLGLGLTLPPRPARPLVPVSLAWDASAGATGFFIYWGPSSRSYTNRQDAGNATNCTVLVPKGELFFAATAYDGSGLESDFSDEVDYVPAPALTNSVRLGFVAWRSRASLLPAEAGVPWVTNEVLVLCVTNAAGNEFDQVIGWRAAVTNF